MTAFLNRRSLLATLPAVVATPALSGEVPPPVGQIEGLFREWEAAKSAFNASSEIDNPDDFRLEDQLTEIENQILATTPHTVREYAFKVIVLNDFAVLEGTPWCSEVLAEARALVA